MINLHFYGAAGTVTGSCYLLDNGRHRLLIDCGLFQGSKAIKERNYGPFPFNPASIDALVLTHAHIDHCGLIPKLYLQGFQGPVFTTPVSAELASVLLPDSGHIQEMEVERKNRKNSRAGLPLLTPIYTAAQAAACLEHFQALDYKEEKEILPGFRLRLQDAGHILGSAIAEIWVRDGEQEVKVTFSGDLGNPGQPIVNDPAPIEATDYLVMESTYGNRHHNVQGDKIERLKEVINRAMKKGGNLVIPAFAVERTQDLLYALNILLRQGAIKVDKIFLDSPLAVAATEIFCRHQDYFDAETKELSNDGATCPFYLPGLHLSRTAEESMAINKIQGGAIIIAASGMCDAGRIKHHLKHNLWRPESTVLLVGYQAAGTLGRRLLDGEKRVRIHGEEIAVRAEIVSLDGFSAHADQAGLLKWLKSFARPPRKVFITHGEEEAARDFASLVTAELGLATEVPQWLATAQLLPLAESLPAASPATLTASAAAAEAEATYQRILVQLKALVEAGFARQDYAGVNHKLQQIAAILNQNLDEKAS
ncbi:MBL fold metallo-hydrolase RNA specificity domain-containing protein [Neomoorella mulderi]|uniref:Ribonuclease n=1 Tax=Moorella mulderi DSM 14980 TaxID=1122241 RepID=A0A151AZY1_9FIRM|nr:MBL fold metallo-hydrolase [Moorella mulderi]KYH33219.1 ribonuclease [Moorella mulderi DSM 14980]